MQRIAIYMIIVLLLVLYACDTKYSLSIDGKTEKLIQFGCGEVNIKANAVARSIFIIEQDFNLTEPSTIYKDSILIKHKGRLLDYTLSHNNNDEIETDTLNITPGEILVISFNVHDPLPNPGDTIIVQDKGYLFCNGTHNDFGEILLITK